MHLWYTNITSPHVFILHPHIDAKSLKSPHGFIYDTQTFLHHHMCLCSIHFWSQNHNITGMYILQDSNTTHPDLNCLLQKSSVSNLFHRKKKRSFSTRHPHPLHCFLVSCFQTSTSTGEKIYMVNNSILQHSSDLWHNLYHCRNKLDDFIKNETKETRTSLATITRTIPSNLNTNST